MPFTEIDGGWAGWKEQVETSEIARTARLAPDLLRSFSTVLITRVDSETKITLAWPSIARLVADHGVCLREQRGRLIAPLETFFVMALEADFFNGFDEVWFFRQEPAGAPAVEGPITTVEALAPEWEARHQAAVRSLCRVVAAMRETGAALGLADGVGLAYITLDRPLAEALEAL